MSAREPRFEVVHTDAGWFARFVASNGQKVWQTEVYQRRRAAGRAIEVVVGLFGYWIRDGRVVTNQPTFTYQATPPVVTTSSSSMILAPASRSIEVREVDEREVTP